MQTPAAELQNLRTPLLSRRDVPVVPGESPLGDLSGQTMELVAEFEAKGAREFGFKVRKGQGQETVVSYDVGRGRLFVDRSRSGIADFSDKFAGRHEAPLAPSGGLIGMRILVDRSSIEAFGNDGLVTITDQIFPDPSSDSVEAYAIGGNARLVSFEAYNLKTIWT